MGLLSCRPLRCFLRQHDKSDASFLSMTNNLFVMPTILVIPTQEGSAIQAAATISSNESIFITALF